jgi:hypothetical integral membrane protein (TIGR02206 family)
MDTFRMLSGLHAAALAVIFGITALAIALARRGRLPPRPTSTERAIGIAYLAAWVTTYSFLLFPPLHEPAKTYPLQLCHWNAVAAALLLATRWNALRPIVYFWGFALSTQAMITPSLTEGPAIYPFWFFWSTHGIIFGSALYEIAARGYRPTARDYGIACAAAALYVAIVLPLDLAFDWNYGFVGRSKPEVRSIVDALGPWPERLAFIFALVAGTMALLLLPWKLKRRTAPGRAATTAAARRSAQSGP